MARFEHQRHKPVQDAPGARDLVLACPPLRSNVNFSRLLRAAGCSGVRQVIVAGQASVDRKIARDAADTVELLVHRSLPPVLKKWRQRGFRLVGLEQTTNSQSLYTYRFQRETVLVLGNERLGLDSQVLDILDDVVEIPMYGLPYSHNAATAAALAIYEYCRQHGGE